ncbi:cupin domain-containing protein [Actinoplanes sp. NPDC051513]|uniref:cupin domain-containing protein n=1 Tax=Actinoplanes sp. NPDC051513 TaxID=3363908 RepID=UPI0037AE9E28
MDIAPVSDGVEVFRLADVAVKHTAADAADVVSGAPTLGTTAITTLGDSGVEVGVWEMSVGAVRDVEIDEVFLVLTGSATITVGSSAFQVGAGDLVRLTAGTSTTWEVTSPLRKLYIA